jgi:hypothetical protein
VNEYAFPTVALGGEVGEAGVVIARSEDATAFSGNSDSAPRVHKPVAIAQAISERRVARR